MHVGLGQFMKERSKYPRVCFAANQLARCDIDLYICARGGAEPENKIKVGQNFNYLGLKYKYC